MRPPPGAGIAQTGQAPALGQLDRGVPAARGVDVRADDEDRVGGAVQLRRQLPDPRGIGCRAAVDRAARLVRERLRVDLGAPVVHRDRDEHRALAAAAIARWAPRAMRVRDVLGARRLVAPLHQRMRHAGRVAVREVRLERHQRARLLPGGDEQRRVVRLGVEDRAHPVADARARCGGSRGRRSRSPARSRPPCRRPPPPGARGRSGSRRGARPASAARSTPGCRTSSSSRGRAAGPAPPRAPSPCPAP